MQSLLFKVESTLHPPRDPSTSYLSSHVDLQSPIGFDLACEPYGQALQPMQRLGAYQ